MGKKKQGIQFKAAIINYVRKIILINVIKTKYFLKKALKEVTPHQ